jgi:phosphoribosyl-ATP pyrophosphohydrolase
MKHRLEALAALVDTIAARKGASPDSSYTAELLAGGIEKCAKKFGEEAVEAALASMTGNGPHLAKEAADVLYHLCVLLEAANVPFAVVMEELQARAAQSGLAEKASRG